MKLNTYRFNAIQGIALATLAGALAWSVSVATLFAVIS
jgi:hypothetical protein